MIGHQHYAHCFRLLITLDTLINNPDASRHAAAVGFVALSLINSWTVVMQTDIAVFVLGT